ncbi:MAG: FliI/YscN family ATPase [Phycisphaerales bacterium]|nr:MAG: FliI/YscN family ATPase [Phycisphaerales bacterium]
MNPLRAQIESLATLQPVRVTGSVAALRGLTLLVDDLPMPVGSTVEVLCAQRIKLGEIVGFDRDKAIVMLLDQTSGVRPGDRVVGGHASGVVPVGRRMLGRVVDALGRPIDGGPPIAETIGAPLSPSPLSPLRRRTINERIDTGVRAVDLMTSVGKGQRMGVFAGPGVGKSTLLGTIAKRTSADVSVIALIGERGREVRDFVEGSLGPEGLARSVVVVATSDESPLLRIRAAMAASSIAEFFRDQGADVMLMMDSITRFAQAQRQVGLSVGEPPATKGYTPSVFSMLPLLLERAGVVEGAGSITAFYAILVEGDDMTEPIADAARGILDGHVILSRKLAQQGHYPAIDVLDSISRVAAEVCDKQHLAARVQLLRLLAAYRDVEELVQIGAYAQGSDPVADVAIVLKERIDDLLRQGGADVEPFDDARKRMLSLAVEAGSMMHNGAQNRQRRQQAAAQPAAGGRA